MNYMKLSRLLKENSDIRVQNSNKFSNFDNLFELEMWLEGLKDNEIDALASDKLNIDPLDYHREHLTEKLLELSSQGIIKEDAEEELYSGSPLAKDIEKVLNSHDPDLNYRDFADAVAEIIQKNYGSHLYKDFLTHLAQSLSKK